MQKKLLLLLTLFVAYLTAEAQVKHVPLIEEWTQASCGPCASQNPAFNALLAQNSGAVVAIKYQTSFPGYDPMNLDNPGEVSTRRLYYGVNGVPTTIMDGTFWPTGRAYKGAPYNLQQSNINTFTSKTSPISVTVSHDIDSAFKTLDVSVILKNETRSSFTSGAKHLFVAIVEKTISWPFSPGSNGETEFYSVMRKMLPDANGTRIKTMSAGKSEEYSFTVDIPSYIHDVGELAIVAWVQDVNSMKIVQAGESDPIDASRFDVTDISLEAEAFEPDGKCDHMVVPKCTVYNDGDEALSGILVGYSIDGGQNFTTKEIQDTVAAFGQIEIEFDPIEAPAGHVTLVYATQPPAALNKRDKYDLDNFFIAPDFVLYETETFAEEASFDFEGQIPRLPTMPEHIIQETKHRLGISMAGPANFGVATNVGAYGRSKQCMIFFYRLFPQGVENYATIQKMDFSRAVHAEMSFDWCMGSPNSSPNTLEVLTSTDCGETWQSIWKKSGDDLRTTVCARDPFFLPDASKWTNMTVDLSSVAGEEEALIRFNMISAGDGAAIGYMDNVKIKRTQTVATGQPSVTPELSNFTIKPNLVHEYMDISFDLGTHSDVRLSLYDATGKQVPFPNAVQSLEKGHHEIRWNRNGTLPGSYLLHVQTNETVIAKKLMIVD